MMDRARLWPSSDRWCSVAQLFVCQNSIESNRIDSEEMSMNACVPLDP